MSRARIITPLTLSTSWQPVPISVPAKSVALQCRTAVDVLLCHHTDDVQYWTIKANQVVSMDLDGQNYLPTVGATNLISNGTFTGGAERWTYDDTDWSYALNAMDKDADGTGTLYQALSAFTPGHVYQVTIVMSNYTVTGLTAAIAGGDSGVTMASNATHTQWLISGRTTTGLLVLTPANAGRFTVDSITVYHMANPILLAKVASGTPTLEIMALV